MTSSLAEVLFCGGGNPTEQTEDRSPAAVSGTRVRVARGAAKLSHSDWQRGPGIMAPHNRLSANEQAGRTDRTAAGKTQSGWRRRT